MNEHPNEEQETERRGRLADAPLRRAPRPHRAGPAGRTPDGRSHGDPAAPADPAGAAGAAPGRGALPGPAGRGAPATTSTRPGPIRLPASLGAPTPARPAPWGAAAGARLGPVRAGAPSGARWMGCRRRRRTAPHDLAAVALRLLPGPAWPRRQAPQPQGSGRGGRLASSPSWPSCSAPPSGTPRGRPTPPPPRRSRRRPARDERGQQHSRSARAAAAARVRAAPAGRSTTGAGAPVRRERSGRQDLARPRRHQHQPQLRVGAGGRHRHRADLERGDPDQQPRDRRRHQHQRDRHRQRQIYKANVVGYDRTGDVAVIQLVGASGLQTAQIAPSLPAVGEGVVGVGNAGGTGGTPSSAGGSVQALSQSITASDSGGGNSENLTGLLETNCDIQPGDSGGALVDAEGKVVGMDTAASTGSTQPRWRRPGLRHPDQHRPLGGQEHRERSCQLRPSTSVPPASSASRSRTPRRRARGERRLGLVPPRLGRLR